MNPTIHTVSAIGRDRRTRTLVVETTLIQASGFFTNGPGDSIEVEVWIQSEYRSGPAAYVSLVTLLDDERALSQTMQIGADRYRALGIPDACLRLLREVVARPLYSSSNAELEWWLSNEIRTEAATNVWRRLQETDEAERFGTDRFVIR